MLVTKPAGDSDIIVTADTGCSYVDDKFFEEDMGEVKDSPLSITYSVNI